MPLEEAPGEGEVLVADRASDLLDGQVPVLQVAARGARRLPGRGLEAARELRGLMPNRGASSSTCTSPRKWAEAGGGVER
jgi:hypothetical protein